MKIKILLSFSFLSLLFSCSSDSSEVEPSSENPENSTNEQVIVNEKEDVTEEMVIDDINPDEPKVSENTDSEEETPNSNEPRVLTAAEQAQLNFAATAIFNKTSSSPNSNAKKWNRTINLFLSGDFNQNEISFITDFSTELNTISSNINMNIVSSFEASNVEIYFATRQEYNRDRPNFIEGYTPSGSAVGRANTRFRTPSFFIIGNKIWVDTSANNFESVTKHEILHILGLDHTEESDSILFPTPSTNPQLSVNDRFAIRTLYNDQLEASSTENEVIITVENNIEEFFD